VGGEEEHFSVGDYDYGEVFEDGVDGDGEVLERSVAGVGHSYEEEGDGQPCFLSGDWFGVGEKGAKCTFLGLVVREGGD
jgi:hypothetical protein